MKEFPIMTHGLKRPCPSRIPWDAIAPFEGQAQENHQQTLERLAERGGLDPVEAFFVMTNRTWNNFQMTDEVEKEACAFIEKVVHDRNELVAERDALKLQNDRLKKMLNDIRGRVWCDSSDLAVEILRRIEDDIAIKREADAPTGGAHNHHCPDCKKVWGCEDELCRLMDANDCRDCGRNSY